MSTQTPSTPVALGYVILYVKDVAASLSFFEKAFGLSRRFFTEQDGKAYGELETGATRLAFCGLNLASESLGMEPLTSSLGKPPLGIEIALTTSDVPALHASALAAGAEQVTEPKTKPWGQVVSYVRSPEGHLIELCTPLP